MKHLGLLKEEVKRIVRYIMGGKVYEITDAFEILFEIEKDHEKLWKQTCQLQCLQTQTKFFIPYPAKITPERGDC